MHHTPTFVYSYSLSILDMVLPLCQKPSREIIKAVLAFSKVTSLALDEALLAQHSGQLVEGRCRVVVQ
jgi:hypothetical protein